MGSDLYSIIESCRRTLDVVQAISESVNWVNHNVNYPHVASQVDYDRMLNIICDSVEVTGMADRLREQLNDYVNAYGEDYAKLGLNSAQADVVRTFINMTDERPFQTFVDVYADLGRPPRVTPPVEMPEAAGVSV